MSFGLFRGGGERHSDRRQGSSRRSPGIPVWKTQVSDFMLAGSLKSHYISHLFFPDVQLTTSISSFHVFFSPSFAAVSLQNSLSRAEGAAERTEEAFGRKHQ